MRKRTLTAQVSVSNRKFRAIKKVLNLKKKELQTRVFIFTHPNRPRGGVGSVFKNFENRKPNGRHDKTNFGKRDNKSNQNFPKYRSNALKRL